jgi:hypothetical protein
MSDPNFQCHFHQSETFGFLEKNTNKKHKHTDVILSDIYQLNAQKLTINTGYENRNNLIQIGIFLVKLWYFFYAFYGKKN